MGTPSLKLEFNYRVEEGDDCNTVIITPADGASKTYLYDGFLIHLGWLPDESKDVMIECAAGIIKGMLDKNNYDYSDDIDLIDTDSGEVTTTILPPSP